MASLSLLVCVNCSDTCICKAMATHDPKTCMETDECYRCLAKLHVPKEACAAEECEVCSIYACPNGSIWHYRGIGCPACCDEPHYHYAMCWKCSHQKGEKSMGTDY